MKALTKILAGGVGLAALASAAPAAAQYYPAPGYGYGAPGYGYGAPGYGYPQSGLGAVIDSILGNNRYAYGVDQRALVNQCVAAVTNRIQRDYAYRYGAPYGAPYGTPYGAPYGGYGYAGTNARVLGITNIDRRSSGLRVRGVATANANVAAYGPYGYAQQPVAELSFRCNIDYRGRILDIDLDRNNNAYAYPYRR
jgi:hypothetical protein